MHDLRPHHTDLEKSVDPGNSAKITGGVIVLLGLLALAVVAITSKEPSKHQLGFILCWMLITLLPYSLLTYIPYVPSRHTYLAGAGLALLVALGSMKAAQRLAMLLLDLADEQRRRGNARCGT